MPDDYRISDLSTAPSIGNSDLMELSVVNAASESGYTSMKAPVLNLANKIVNETQYASDLQTQNKTITGAINELAQGGGGGGSDADIVKTASGNPCSFSTSFAGALKSLTASIVCGGGGGTPSNPIPIVGHSELNLTRCGVNFLPLKFYKGLEYNTAVGTIFDTEEATDGTVSGNTVSFNVGSWGRKCMLSPKLPTGVDFRLSMTVTSSATNLNYTEYYLDKDLKVTRRYNIQNSGTSRTVNAGFTLNDNECYIAIELGCSNSATIVFDSPMLNVGSTPLPYAPHNGQTFTVAFGQTVYGGVLDKSGRLTITHQIMTPTIASIRTNYTNIDYATIQKTHANKAYGNYDFHNELANMAICSRNVPNYDSADHIGKLFTGATGDLYWIGVPKGTTLEQTRTLYTGLEICYELATPIVIDVQAISVSAEKGVNNITSDCGGDVDVEYYTDLAEDIKDFIGDNVEVGDLANVEITTPSNNQVLKYDSTSQKWVNGTGGGGASDLDDLGDVEITTPSNDQVLKYDSASQKWVNGNASSGSAHNYSTTEQVVGTWVDGSPVYEKTVYSAGGVTGNFDIPHNVSNLDRVISYSGTVKDTDFSTYHDIWSIPRLDNIAVGIDRFTTTVIKVVNPSEFNNRLVDWYITFRYTKST